MSEILSQDEISALLQSMKDEQVTSDTEYDEQEPGDVIAYDFTSPDRALKSEFGYLKMINDKYSLWLSESLTNTLRRTVGFKSLDVEIKRFGNVLMSLSFPTSLNILRVEQLKGSCLLIFPPDLVFAFVEVMFGGQGGSGYAMEVREFTTIEQKIIQKMIALFTQDYQEAWKTVYAIAMTPQKTEMDPRYLRFVTDDEPVVINRFEITIGEAKYRMLYCFPYSLVEPVRGIYEDQLKKERQQQDETAENKLRELIQDAKVNLYVKAGKGSISGKELLSLQTGDIIRLGEGENIPATVQVEGVNKYHAFLGRCKTHVAVKICSIYQEGA